MPIVTRTIRHEMGGIAFEMLAAWDGTIIGPRPAVMVAGTFMGRTPFEDEKAVKLAEAGYVGVAVDVYGVDTRPSGPESAQAAMGVLNGDRALLRDRMFGSLAAVRGLDAPVDPARIAAIGFCFGGKCVLDLARAGGDVLGIATFHGVYDAPPFVNAAITAKALILDGWDDPLCPPDAKVALAKELNDAGADWQLLSYGRTVHAFTNPKRPEMYRPLIAARSWRALDIFLAEIFG